ncbi:MAG: transglycosylase SLT domain-containing protein [Myxococcota bacterium]
MSFAVNLVAVAAALTLEQAPPVPPGRAAPLPADLLQAAIDRRTQGDPHTAAWYYESWLAKKGGDARTRAAVQLALGLTYLDLGAPNLASAMFSKVRVSQTPVAPYGAWYEALADHRRGRHAVAAKECAAYRKQWPAGPHADECLVLMGDAWVAAGERGPAVAAYNQWLDAHPDSPREETMRLGIALAVANGDPRAGIPMLQSLVVDHAYHSTGETAQARLDALAAKGHDTKLPDAVEWKSRRAAERKRCGYDGEAWKLFRELADAAQDDPKLQAWIDAQEDNFAWSTKQYDQLAASLAKDYEAKPSADLAWKRYKALARGGQWAAAVDQWQDAAKKHPTSGQFRGKVDLARAQLLAGRYTEAREGWTALGKTGGALGREAKWLAAFAAFRLGDFEDALKRLDALVNVDSWEGDAARYYRARTLDALGRAAEADAQRDAILKRDPHSWYAALVRGMSDEVGDPWLQRAGRWPGPDTPRLPPLPRVGSAGAPVATPAAVDADVRTVDWSRLAWGAPPPASTAAAAIASAPPPAIPYETRPDSYRRSFLYDPRAADELLGKLAEDHAERFPDLAAAVDLARAGVFDLSAPILGRAYDAIEQQDLDVGLDLAEWRQVFMFARDDHHTARFCWGAAKLASTEEQRLAALRCQFPAAHPDALWRHGMAYDVDPLLAMGLMRQESVYRQWALSPVGAMGLMQVMPRTGSRVAALMGDPHYSPEQLEDPATNVRYGVWYLSRLLDRFGGAFPLAVASYNGGPHNVSSWLRPWGETIRMDDYVEQIPYPETRDYVKKVTGYYATYVALYGPADGHLRIPTNVRLDDPTVIDF